MGVFFSEPEFHNLPEWGVFEHSFPDFCKLSAELGINGFTAEKPACLNPSGWRIFIHIPRSIGKWEKGCFGESAYLQQICSLFRGVHVYP
jgi:hypothetical protein